MTFYFADVRLGDFIVLILFLRRLSVSECVETFNNLTQQLFSQSSIRRSHLSRLRHLLKSWYRNECHEVQTLEVCLKKELRPINRLFDRVQSLVATKVDVTAATIDKGFSILMTNYNDQDKINKNCDE